ncbi:MAG: outer membrane beta-barrel family protein, partial [Maribacter sp.]|nr:outer membrane beta-barrel family protein [Maribacter sp.]
VNKVMVNGKDFFDGDTKLATKNIPSKAVDKIQVLRNYSEVGQLRSVTNNQDNVALNIKLKEGKENFWFGNITGGAGTSPDNELYLVQPKLFYYSPKYSLNFIGDINNTGEVALTRRDIRNFGGGFRAPSRSSGTSINLGDNSLNFLTSQGNALEIENKLATGNFSYSPSQALDLSGFLIYNSSRIISKETNFVQYTDPGLGIPDEATEQSSRERSNQGLLKLSASYQPNINNQLDYDILGRVSNDTQNQRVFSSVIGNTNQLDEVTPFSLNQNINYYYTLDESNIFAFEAQHLLKNEDPFYNAILVNDPNGLDAFDTTAEALGIDTSPTNYDLGQKRRIKSNQLDAKLDYYNILNAKSNINFTLGTILSRQEFNSNIFQFLGDGSQFNPTPTFNDGLASNDIAYNFSDIYLGVHYRFKTGKFTITPGFSVHAYGNKNVQFGETFKDNFFRFLPDFETRIQLKKSEALTLKYDMRNQFTDVTRLAQGLVLNNFNSIQFGEPDLQNALSHNVSLFYSSFNLFNYTNVFARAAYTSNIDQIRSLTNFENVIRTSTFFNSSFADENVNVFGRVQRTFGKIRATLNASFNYSKINQFIQGQQSLNEGFTQTYTPGIRTNYKIAPNVSLRYRYSVTNNNQGGGKTEFVTNAPSVEFDAYIWKAVTFRTNYSYTNQESSEGQSQSFQNWDATLSYRKNRDAKWEYEIKATNILDIDSQVRNNANNFSVFTSETFIQPRFVTFRFVYTL